MDGPLLKNFMNNSKDGPTFGKFGKSVERLQKTWDFYEIMPKCPKVEKTFEDFSQFLLKVSIEMLLGKT